MGIHAMRFSNRVHNLVLNIYNANRMEWEGVNIIVLTRSEGMSAKCNNIYRKSQKHKRFN
jgi:hypothetical protein